MGQQSGSSFGSRSRRLLLGVALASGVMLAGAIGAREASAQEHVVVRVAPPAAREPAHWSERGGYWHFVEGHWRRQ